MGSAPWAFIRWGGVANVIRMLTLVLIFAYMVLFFQVERGSFLVSGLSAFFLLMPVEVMQLLQYQNKVGEKLECVRDANKYN